MPAEPFMFLAAGQAPAGDPSALSRGSRAQPWGTGRLREAQPPGQDHLRGHRFHPGRQRPARAPLSPSDELKDEIMQADI